jgi:hypothetical protein
MVRHRTPRTRRRSQKRRLQLGGYDIPSPFKNTAELEAYIRAKLPQGLPSPGQKRGICGTDALAGGFYADGIRQLLWETLVFSQGANPRINTRRIETSGEVPDEEQVLFSILHRFAATQSTVRLTATAPGRFARSETIRGDATAPVDLGEECNRIVVKFFKKVAGPSRENLAAYGGISHEDLGRAQHALIQYLGRKRGDEAIGGVSGADPSSNVYTPVAINLFVQHLDGSGPHETALVLIQGGWWFLDDNIGIAVPLLKPDGSGVTYGDIVSTQFKEVYESGHITLFLVYPDGREMQLNTTLPRLVKERAGTIGPLIEGRPRTFVYIKTAALTGAAPAPAPAPAPAVAGGRWVRAPWATMMAETRANLDQFFATQCFPASKFSAWPEAQSQEIWYYISGTIKFAASVGQNTPPLGRLITSVCTSQEARRTGLLGQFFSHLLAAYPETPGFRLVAADTNDQGLTLAIRLGIYERYGFRLPPTENQKITLNDGSVVTIADYAIAQDGRSYLYNNGAITSARIKSCAGEPGGCAMMATLAEMKRAIGNWEELVRQNPVVTATPAPAPAPAPAPPAPAPAPAPPAPAPNSLDARKKWVLEQATIGVPTAVQQGLPAAALLRPPFLPTDRAVMMGNLREWLGQIPTRDWDDQGQLDAWERMPDTLVSAIRTNLQAYWDRVRPTYALEMAGLVMNRVLLLETLLEVRGAAELAGEWNFQWDVAHASTPENRQKWLEERMDALTAKYEGWMAEWRRQAAEFESQRSAREAEARAMAARNEEGRRMAEQLAERPLPPPARGVDDRRQGPVGMRNVPRVPQPTDRRLQNLLVGSRDGPSFRRGGRRKTFRRRRSSLPKRTGPSSGHSRRYSRRRQASRS